MPKKKKQNPIRKHLLRAGLIMTIATIILLFALLAILPACACTMEIDTYDVTLTMFARMKTQAAATPVFVGG